MQSTNFNFYTLSETHPIVMRVWYDFYQLVQERTEENQIAHAVSPEFNELLAQAETRRKQLACEIDTRMRFISQGWEWGFREDVTTKMVDEVYNKLAELNIACLKTKEPWKGHVLYLNGYALEETFRRYRNYREEDEAETEKIIDGLA